MNETKQRNYKENYLKRKDKSHIYMCECGWCFLPISPYQYHQGKRYIAGHEPKKRHEPKSVVSSSSDSSPLMECIGILMAIIVLVCFMLDFLF